MVNDRATNSLYVIWFISLCICNCEHSVFSFLYVSWDTLNSKCQEIFSNRKNQNFILIGSERFFFTTDNWSLKAYSIKNTRLHVTCGKIMVLRQHFT